MPVVYYRHFNSVANGRSDEESLLNGQIIKVKKLEEIAAKIKKIMAVRTRRAPIGRLFFVLGCCACASRVGNCARCSGSGLRPGASYCEFFSDTSFYRCICCYNFTLMKPLPLILMLSIFLVAPLRASQDGIVVRAAAVYAQASDGSKRIGQVTAGTTVSIFSRRGGWKEIFSDDNAIVGWVRGYQVRETTAAAPVSAESESDSRGFLAGLASFSRKASSFFKSGKGNTSSGTATIGVRGLSAEEINSAQADFAEFEKMKRFASSTKRAGKFARQGGLSAIKVPHISGKQ